MPSTDASSRATTSTASPSSRNGKTPWVRANAYDTREAAVARETSSDARRDSGIAIVIGIVGTRYCGLAGGVAPGMGAGAEGKPDGGALGGAFGNTGICGTVVSGQ